MSIEPERIVRVANAKLRGEHPFNPALVRHERDWLLAYRTRHANAEIGLATLDENFVPIREVPFAPPRVQVNEAGVEDPRMFYAHGSLWLSYNGLNSIPGGVCSNVCLARLRDDLSVAEHWTPKLPGTVWEKNWGFFPHGDGMRAVYGIHPHAIVDAFPDRSVWVSSDDWGFGWDYGPARGGAAPVRRGDLFYSFFHGRLESIPDPAAHGLPYYVAGVYVFEAAAPHRPRAFLPGALLKPDLSQKTWKAFNTAFVCGAWYEAGKWYVSYGHVEQWCEVAIFDAEALDAAMRWL